MPPFEISEDSYYQIETDKPGEECGVFGLIFPGEEIESVIVNLTLAGLFLVQHRGEESAGIVTADGEKLSPALKSMGKIRDGIFPKYLGLDVDGRKKLEGYIASAHTRYSTTGSSTIENAGPFVCGEVGVSHNGNITNAERLKKFLMKMGVEFKATTDSEVIAALVEHAPGANMDQKIQAAMRKLRGSFSLVIATPDALYGVRDGMGNRPLSLAEIHEEGTDKVGYALSSETPAFYDLGFDLVRDIGPGEIVKLTKNDEGEVVLESLTYLDKKPKPAFCGLEIAYLMRPDAYINEAQLDTIRRALGTRLAELSPPPSVEDIDFVTYVPESSRPAAEAFAEAIGKPTRTAMLKGRYGTSLANGAVRGFINPDQAARSQIARRYSPHDILIGKNIILVDDSIVRGTTTAGVVEVLRNRVGLYRDKSVGKIFLYIIFPPIKGPCYLGTDIGENDTLIARGKTIEQIAEELGVDGLFYLPSGEYQDVVNREIGKEFPLCLACATLQQPELAFETEEAEATEVLFEE